MKRLFISTHPLLRINRPSCALAVTALALATGYPRLSAETSPPAPSAAVSIKQAALQQYNLPADKVALQGYDPVAYFTENKATKGSPDMTAMHLGVTYHFSSAANKKRFEEAPEKYLPTYGGWCATAMAKGEKVEIDPTNFKVSGNRLFLFYKGLWGNARKDWDKDEPTGIVKADANWKKISGE